MNQSIPMRVSCWLLVSTDLTAFVFTNKCMDCCGCDPHRASGLRAGNRLVATTEPILPTPHDRLHTCQSTHLLVLAQGVPDSQSLTKQPMDPVTVRQPLHSIHVVVAGARSF